MADSGAGRAWRRLRRSRAVRRSLRVTARLDGGSPWRLDLIGAVLVALAGVWALLAAAGRPASPEGFLLALLTVAAAYGAGRIAGARSAFGTCATVAGAVAVLMLLSPDALSGAALAEPLGYGNANGALVAQAVAAACLAALAAPSDRRRGDMHVLAGLLALAAFATRSLTAVFGAVAVLLVGLTALSARRRGSFVLAGAVAVALVVAGTVSLGGDRAERASGVRSTAADGLTERRIDLWHDAFESAKDNPWRGTGPGTFLARSPTARADSDTKSAHSQWLRQAAEQGVPGVVLLAALLGWAYVRLWRSRQDPAVVAVGAVALTAFAVHASMDYVAEFPPVLVAVGVVLGVATAAPDPESAISRESRR
ncbi:O-antigen ligase family protein [Yinghuangia sp. ASG 101]|uniref:O-antigen ligase family protein n=1 Tax=Yinghuangia sp. ASG 101 TaxID=2896848 RepID=UPI001E2B711A|nr:O-antigen ligase family protein [Yinghuangia sp. ASG 101]UGQ10596.1 O-antigen ligase family protein [Yinghuangia sp. ASG 101]